MTILNVTSTRLEKSGKRGILKPNADGYYTMPVGGLEVCNTSGVYYTSGDGVRELFTSPDSMLQRLLRDGALKGENGHPKPYPGESDDAYQSRAMYPDEKNIAVFFRRIWLDLDFGRNHPEYNNPNMIAIMAEFKPDGVHGHLLQAALDDPDQNVCFSIRSLAEDIRVNGRRVRAIREVITFDYVTLPGIRFATKWHAPALEDAVTGKLDRAALMRIAANDDRGGLRVANEHARHVAQSVLERWKPADGGLGFKGW